MVSCKHGTQSTELQCSLLTSNCCSVSSAKRWLTTLVPALQATVTAQPDIYEPVAAIPPMPIIVGGG